MTYALTQPWELLCFDLSVETSTPYNNRNDLSSGYGSNDVFIIVSPIQVLWTDI